jgi:RHS repeat-associated protein
MTQSTFDEETSGYFLVPAGALPQGWRHVDADEGSTVWGRGDTGNNHDNGGTGDKEVKAFPCGPGGGCTRWNVEASVVGLELRDDPIGYKPPFGPEIRFPMTYSHRDVQQPSPFTYTNFGDKWTLDWLSYVVDNPTNGYLGDEGVVGYTIPGGAVVQYPNPTLSITADLYRRGGGDEPYIFPNISPAQPQANGTSQPSVEGQFSQATMTRNVSASGAVSFTRNLPDGSAEKFTLALGAGTWNTKYFMTEVDDPQGNPVTIHYDSLMRITWLQDAAGQRSILCYSDSSAPCVAGAQPPPSNLQVTEIIDPFGRTARFGYDITTGHLISITDVLGITSTYHYTTTSSGPTDFVDTLTTPYETTTFSYTESASGVAGTATYRTLKATETSLWGNTPPRTSYVAFHQGNGAGFGSGCSATATPPASAIPVGSTMDPNIECTDGALPASLSLPNYVSIENTNLKFRNTFVWNPEQYVASLSAPNPYLSAKIMHWLHTDNSDTNSLTASRVLESVKEPLEARVWFTYQAQSVNEFTGQNSLGVGLTNQPTNVIRAVQNAAGTYQYQQWQYTYDFYGHVKQSVDPLGRTLSMNYDPKNNVDLLTVTNKTPLTSTTSTNDLLLTFSGYINHRPWQVTGANGQTTKLTYNASGQVLTSTDPLKNTWTYSYAPAAGGFLTGIVGPTVTTFYGGAQTPQYAYTYDNVGRLRTEQGPDGRLLTFSYDSADRLTATAFPDGTTELRGYTYQTKPFLDLTSFTDRMGYTTTREYDGFRDLIEIDEPAARSTKLSYNPDGTVQAMTDPLGHVATYARDLEGRVQSVTRADNSMEWQAYDALGRVVSKSPDQAATGAGTVLYAYNLDDTTATALIDARAPTDFYYDSAYPRLVEWSRAQGGTWANPRCGACLPLDGEFYTYNPVGVLGANRLQGVSTLLSTHLPSTASAFASAYTYDALDRVSGTTTSNTVGVHETLTSAGDSFGYDALGRLTSDVNNLDRFSYAYGDATSRVTGRTSAGGPQLAATYLPPQQDGLLQQLSYTAPGGAALAKYSYAYDARHNVTSFSDSAAGTSSFAYDQYNQLLTAGGPGSGTSSVVDDNAGNLSSVTTAFPAVGRFARPSTTATSFSYDTGNKMTQDTLNETGLLVLNNVQPITSNSVGSIASDGSSYLYDQSNRLSFATDGNTYNTFFLYDGLGRLSEVYGTNGAFGSAATAGNDHSYGWCGTKMCIELDNLQTQAFIWPPQYENLAATLSGTPDALYVAQGTVTSSATTSGYDITDQLGNERAFVVGNAIVAQYEYDTFGDRTVVSGDAAASNRGFTGFYYHAASGLQFAQNRVYNASLGRWMTRDPIGIDHAFMDPERFNATDLNLYAYAGNNPQSMSDPSGYCSTRAWYSVDYFTVNVNLTGPFFLGINPQFTLDKNLHAYFGFGGGPGLPGANGYYGLGHMVSDSGGPTEAQLIAYITGDSLNVSAGIVSPYGAGLGGGGSFNANGASYEAGIQTGFPGPSVSVTWQHTWQIF